MHMRCSVSWSVLFNLFGSHYPEPRKPDLCSLSFSLSPPSFALTNWRTRRAGRGIWLVHRRTARGRPPLRWWRFGQSGRSGAGGFSKTRRGRHQSWLMRSSCGKWRVLCTWTCESSLPLGSAPFFFPLFYSTPVNISCTVCFLINDNQQLSCWT